MISASSQSSAHALNVTKQPANDFYSDQFRLVTVPRSSSRMSKGSRISSIEGYPGNLGVARERADLIDGLVRAYCTVGMTCFLGQKVV